MDYFERVASVMKASYSAGSLNSYDTILTALHKHFKTEGELRAYIEGLEARFRRQGMPPDWHFIDGDVTRST